jgi:serine protease Do
MASEHIEPEKETQGIDLGETDPRLWHPKTSATTRPARHRFGVTFAILFVVITFLLGSIGGVMGIVVLANSTSPAATKIKSKLGLSSNSLSIPVHQTITLTEDSAVIDAAKKVSPAVVSITGSAQLTDFFGRSYNQDVSGGTGFILTSDGYIITNKHVVNAPGVTYKVVLNDGRVFDAQIKAMDSYSDFAVLKIDATGLSTVELGSSDDLKIGQSVLAIGNALGEFGNSVTLGVVSAKGRSLTASDGGSLMSQETLTDLIQTDAAINPGNSGGPLVNMLGQVVGINTAIASTTGGSVGIGFAIPINDVSSLIDSVRKTGQIIRPYIGVRYQVVNTTMQQLNKLPVNYGAFVTSGSNPAQPAVIPGSPADKAGIKAGDILLELNGERITEDNPLPKLLMKYQPGNTVTLKLNRDNKEMTVSVTLGKLAQ